MYHQTFVYSYFTDDIYTVSLLMIVEGINETSFVSMKPMLVNIVAGITNSSASAIELRIKRRIISNDSVEYSCKVSVRPTDRNHEKYVVSKMEFGDSFLFEINSIIQNQTTENVLRVIYVSPLQRRPGNLTYVKVF